MALLKPDPNQKKVKFKAELGAQTHEAISEYCEWAGFRDAGEFIDKVVEFALDKDTDWKKHVKDGGSLAG